MPPFVFLRPALLNACQTSRSMLELESGMSNVSEARVLYPDIPWQRSIGSSAQGNVHANETFDMQDLRSCPQ